MTTCLLLFFQLCLGQPSVVSWNLYNLGSSKSDKELTFIADVMSPYDLIAIQEVVAGPAGPLAIKRLVKQLNKGKTKWSSVVSAPTSGSAQSSERYAFIWRTDVFSKKVFAWLDKTYAQNIDREPYVGKFIYQNKPFILINFHATQKKKKPEREIKLLLQLQNSYPDQRVIFLGDFNTSPAHTVFNPLKKTGWKPAFPFEKTTLKQKCLKDDCLASRYDNIWYQPTKIRISNARVLPFYKSFRSLKDARSISDHLPVTCQLQFE